MTQSIVDLARSRFGELNPAEERLLVAVAEGRTVDFSAPPAGQTAARDATPARADRPHGPVTSDSGSSFTQAGVEVADASLGRVLRADRVAWLATEGGRFVTHRGIAVKGARIDGRLDLQAANIVFPIHFERCELAAGISLLGAEIHALNLSGSTVGRISADGMKVEAGVYLRAGFRAQGRVRLSGATIGGNLDCDGGHFICSGSEAIVADGLKVQGSISLGAGFRAEGQVRLPGAQIGGSLNCSGGALVNAGADAIVADRLKVDGNVFFSEGFLVDGRVGLPGAQIAGYLVWNAAGNPQQATIDLRSARVGTLWMDRASWPAPGKLHLHGLTYDEMDERAAVDSAARIAWLQLQPPTPFRPQPYEQLATVLRRDGYADDAKQILYAKEVDRARLTRLSWSEWPWYRLFGPLIGYGYKPWRAFWLSLAVVILGTVLFAQGSKAGLMTPAKGEAYLPDKPTELANFYPKLQPFMYSLDTFTPLISLDQADYWFPNSELGTTIELGPLSVTTGSMLRSYMWFHIVAGWILSTLLFVGLTGSVPGA